MKTIVNKTRSALKIPLSRGKVLRLGASASGQIRDEDELRPALQKLVASGAVEVVAPGPAGRGGNDAGTGPGSAGRGEVKPAVRHREGDR